MLACKSSFLKYVLMVYSQTCVQRHDTPWDPKIVGNADKWWLLLTGGLY